MNRAYRLCLEFFVIFAAIVFSGYGDYINLDSLYVKCLVRFVVAYLFATIGIVAFFAKGAARFKIPLIFISIIPLISIFVNFDIYKLFYVGAGYTLALIFLRDKMMLFLNR